MGAEHKGDVRFDYWTSNPWSGRASLHILAPCPDEKVVTVAARIVVDSTHHDMHVASWVSPARDRGTRGETARKDVLYHYDGFFDEAPD